MRRKPRAESPIEAVASAVDEETHDSVAKSTALMSAATLISRVTGLVRTWAMAFALGNTLVTSAYQVANNMPNVVFDLVAGGLLGAAFIPVYLLEKEKKGDAGGNAFACNLLNLTIIVLGALTLLSSIFAPQLIATQTFTVGEFDEVVSLSVAFFRIFAFQIVFYGISGIVTAVLNANRVYFLPAMAPALNNVCVIVSFFAYIPLSASNQQLAILVLGVGTTLGVAVQALMQIPALLKTGFKYRFFIRLNDPALIEAMKIALPTMLYIVGTLVAFSCRNAFSLQVGDNGPSTLLYAWTWFQLPYGVVSVSLSRALFTEMGEASAKEDMPALRELVRAGLSGNLMLIIPLVGHHDRARFPLMELFQAGAFNAGDVSLRADRSAFGCTACRSTPCSCSCTTCMPRCASLCASPLSAARWSSSSACCTTLLCRRHQHRQQGARKTQAQLNQTRRQTPCLVRCWLADVGRLFGSLPLRASTRHVVRRRVWLTPCLVCDLAVSATKCRNVPLGTMFAWTLN